MIALTVALTLWTACPQGMLAVPTGAEAMRLVGRVLEVEPVGFVSVGRDSCVWCLRATEAR